MTLASQLPMCRKIRKGKPRCDISSQQENNAPSSRARSMKPTLGQKVKGFFHSKQPAVSAIGSPAQNIAGLAPELSTEVIEHYRKDPIIADLTIKVSKSLDDGPVTALVRSVFCTTAMTAPSTQSAGSDLINEGSQQPVDRQSTDGANSGKAVEELVPVDKGEPSNPSTSSTIESEPAVADLPKVTNSWMEAEFAAQERREQIRDRRHIASAVARHNDSSLPDIVENSVPSKKVMESSSNTSSPENIKRSEMVEEGSSSSSLGKSIKFFNDGTPALELRAYEAQIEDLKDAHEDEIIRLRRENEDKLADLRRKLLKSEAAKVHEQERAETAARESQHRDDKAANLEKEAEALRQRCSGLEGSIKSMKTKTKGKGKAKETSQQENIDSTPQESDHDFALAQAISERDLFQQQNIEVQKSLDAANIQLQKCQSDVADLQTAVAGEQWKLSSLRVELERSPSATAETDELLKKQAEMHNLLVKEHNVVIGQNSELRGQLSNLEASHREELDSLKTELGTLQSRENDLTDKHDRWKLYCNQVIERLQSKMTVADVEDTFSSMWRLVNDDNEKLKERVASLTSALDFSNKSRLESSDTLRKTQRIFQAKIKENEDLWEYKNHAQVEIDAIKVQMDFHTPGCTDIIADRDREIEELSKQFEDSKKRHEEHIRAGASEGAMMLLQDKEDMANLQQQRLDTMRQELDECLNECHVQCVQLKWNENYNYKYAYELENWKARAISAEQEVDKLRKQLDKGDEQLADPRKWEHWRLCSEWKAHGEVVVDEYNAKKAKIEGIIGGLWQRMLDFEHQAQYNGLPDPDECLEEDRRADIAKDFEAIFHYAADSYFTRRTEGDPEPEPLASGNEDGSAAPEEAESPDSDLIDDFDEKSEGESADDDEDSGLAIDRTGEGENSTWPDKATANGIEDGTEPTNMAQAEAAAPTQDVPSILPLLQREYSTPIETPTQDTDVQEDYEDPLLDTF